MTKAETILKYYELMSKTNPLDFQGERWEIKAMKEISILSFDAGTKKDWIGGKSEKQFIEELF